MPSVGGKRAALRRGPRCGPRPGRRVAAMAAMAAMVVLVMPVSAEPASFRCAALVASTSQQPAYGPVPGQQRCEGFYVKNVSQPFIELVSLTRSAPGSWAADADGRLQLRGLARLDARLLVQPLRPSPLYRVDLGLARGTTVNWRSDTMLKATGLKLKDLGLLAWVDADAEPMALAPVSARDDDDTRTAYAVLRPSIAVSKLAWRAYRLDPAVALPGDWQALAGPPLFAWERIALPIELPADGRGVRIDVRGLDGQGQPIPLLQFAIVGALDGTP